MLQFSVGVLVVSVLQMILGMVWYGAFFGKLWMKFMGMEQKNEAEIKAMQKAAMPLYGIQFGLSAITNIFLGILVSGAAQGIIKGVFPTLFFLWLAFVMPIQAGGIIWDNLSTKHKWQKFLISTSYQLLAFVVAGVVFIAWF